MPQSLGRASCTVCALGAFLSFVAIPWGLAGAARSSSAATLSVELEIHSLPPEAARKTSATVTATWYGEGKRPPIHFRVAASEPASVTLPVGRWTLAAEAKGLWGAEAPVEVKPDNSRIRLSLWPAGTVKGGFIAPPAEPAPSSLVVFFRPRPEQEATRGLQPGRSACALGRLGWRCRLPAGVHDLRFQAAGFIPRYLWSVALPAGKAVALGRLDLHRGSSVLGWVVAADGSRLGPEVTVELRPRQAGPVRELKDRDQLVALRLRTSLNERGFFQIEGVAPGAYVVEARHPKLATATATVLVVPGQTTEISNPPLTLQEPKVAEVFLTPALGPEGDAWRIELLRLDRDSSVLTSVGAGPAGADGSWRSAALAPGRFLLKVGRGIGDTWFSKEVELEATSPPLFLQLTGIPVRGQVYLGEDPLRSASLIFGGRHGAVRIEVAADSKGEFQTYLPKEGDWAVFVSSEQPRVSREVPNVPVRAREGKNLAEVEIRLAKTLLRGKVVDEAGKPLSRAIVSARSLHGDNEKRVQERANEDGTFELHGLRVGPALVSAEAEGDHSSDTVVASVSEDDSAELVLTARAQTHVRGVVFSAAGPVPGARIKAAPVGVPYLSVRTATSDAQGRFELVLAPSAREMLVSLGAPGFAFRLLRLAVPEDHTLSLGLDQAGGTLVVQHDPEMDWTNSNGPQIFLLKGGAMEGLPYLLGWASQQGVALDGSGRDVLPALEPGVYQACLVWPEERDNLERGLPPSGRCASGVLTPQGELTLKLTGFERSANR